MTVQVSDGAGGTDTQAIAVTVTPVNDNNPVITTNGGGATAAVNVAENTTAVTTVTATDADLPAQTLTYSIIGGADAAQFTINAATGVLSFLAAPDYETPTDAGANNVYDVTVQVSDGGGGTDTPGDRRHRHARQRQQPGHHLQRRRSDGGGQRGREHHGRHDRHGDRRRPAGADADLLDHRAGPTRRKFTINARTGV